LEVAAGSVRVTDIGTVFDVEQVADAVEVRVFQGSASVTAQGAGERTLRRGGWIVLDPRLGVAQGHFDPNTYRNWRTDWLQAENMPLKYAIARLNRYSADKISVDDPKKADVALTGRFDLRKTDATVQMISSLLKLKPVHKSDGLHLENDGPN
jgi:transmembrane sensor